MLNVGSVILSYQSLADRLVALVLDVYPIRDRYFRFFHRRVPSVNATIIRHVWSEEDIRQEIYLFWLSIIQRYYSPQYARHRRGAGTLEAFLFKHGTLHMARRIQRIVRDFETSYRYCERAMSPSNYSSDLIFTNVTLEALMKKPNFKAMETLDGKARVFLYRFLIEDKSLKELTNEFGSWRDVQKILARVHKILFMS